jgi:hypothetical protein
MDKMKMVDPMDALAPMRTIKDEGPAKDDREKSVSEAVQEEVENRMTKAAEELKQKYDLSVWVSHFGLFSLPLCLEGMLGAKGGEMLPRTARLEQPTLLQLLQSENAEKLSEMLRGLRQRPRRRRMHNEKLM